MPSLDVGRPRAVLPSQSTLPSGALLAGGTKVGQQAQNNCIRFLNEAIASYARRHPDCTFKDFKATDRLFEVGMDDIPKDLVQKIFRSGELCRYFQNMAFGKEVITDKDRPWLRRSGTLNTHRSNISTGFGLGSAEWDDRSQTGNPIQSAQMRQLMGFIKDCEGKGEAAEDTSNRPFELSEFLALLMARHWEFCLRGVDTPTKMYSFKKDLERSVGNQKSRRLDFWFKKGGSGGVKVSPIIKENAIKRLVGCVQTPDWRRETPRTAHLSTKDVGTYSTRKGAKTDLDGRCEEWETEQRGRWTLADKSSRRYSGKGQTKAFSPLVDARVAQQLCGPGGPARISFKDPRLLSDAFIKSIIPGLHSILDPQVADVLAKNLLGHVLLGDADDMLDEAVLDRIRTAAATQLDVTDFTKLKEFAVMEPIGITVSATGLDGPKHYGFKVLRLESQGVVAQGEGEGPRNAQEGVLLVEEQLAAIRLDQLNQLRRQEELHAIQMDAFEKNQREICDKLERLGKLVREGQIPPSAAYRLPPGKQGTQITLDRMLGRGNLVGQTSGRKGWAGSESFHVGTSRQQGGGPSLHIIGRGGRRPSLKVGNRRRDPPVPPPELPMIDYDVAKGPPNLGEEGEKEVEEKEGSNATSSSSSSSSAAAGDGRRRDPAAAAAAAAGGGGGVAAGGWIGGLPGTLGGIPEEEDNSREGKGLKAYLDQCAQQKGEGEGQAADGSVSGAPSAPARPAPVKMSKSKEGKQLFFYVKEGFEPPSGVSEGVVTGESIEGQESWLESYVHGVEPGFDAPPMTQEIFQGNLAPRFPPDVAISILVERATSPAKESLAQARQAYERATRGRTPGERGKKQRKAAALAEAKKKHDAQLIEEMDGDLKEGEEKQKKKKRKREGEEKREEEKREEEKREQEKREGEEKQKKTKRKREREEKREEEKREGEEKQKKTKKKREREEKREEEKREEETREEYVQRKKEKAAPVEIQKLRQKDVCPHGRQ
eukprot:Cvel_30984.t1-p1 / transcript=Cvel_30984.t1 / gene=Cvel_30984 / organism=Chromera_velia_CCMP2878 / gene_product=hypothetical protein / transcript_product=hypothetical protein / location=Cvel_scaffold4524:1862-8346(-) / protein_length=993 / sequence_SO=supercontig / SO=protein_coding / is_pseudo=false